MVKSFYDSEQNILTLSAGWVPHVRQGQGKIHGHFLEQARDAMGISAHFSWYENPNFPLGATLSHPQAMWTVGWPRE